MDRGELGLKNAIDIASFLLYFFMMLLLETALFFMAKLSISWITLPLALIGAGAVFWYVRKADLKRTVIILFVSFAIIVGMSFISGLYFDRSWDGNAYHKLAVGLLKNGWNPVWEVPNLEMTEGPGHTDLDEIWCEGYCKGTWIYAASIYSLCNNIEAGKSYTIIGMIAAGLLAYFYLKKKNFSKEICVLGAALVGFNPISTQQLDSFYLDGFLHSMILCLIISLLMLQDEALFDKRLARSLVLSSMVISGNVKFTGLLYGGIFCIAFYLYACINEFRANKSFDNRIIGRTVRYICLAIVTFVWAGNSTYMTNIIRHKTPVYPLLGGDNKDIMTGNSPFLTENRIKNLFISMFAYTDNTQSAKDGGIDLKIPFTFSVGRELRSIILPDSRIGGFGIFFSGVLCFAIVGLVLYFVKTKKDKNFWLIITLLVACVFLTLAIKESWWARYSPYIYVMVVVGVLALIADKAVVIKRIGFVIALILLLNNLLPLISFPLDLKRGFDVRNEFASVKAEMPIEVFNDNFVGVYYNFKDANIDYTINESLADESDVNMMEYCETLWRAK